MNVYGLLLPNILEWNRRMKYLSQFVDALPNPIILIICEYGSTFNLQFDRKGKIIKNPVFQHIPIIENFVKFKSEKINIQISVRSGATIYDLLLDNIWRQRRTLCFVEYYNVAIAFLTPFHEFHSINVDGHLLNGLEFQVIDLCNWLRIYY